MLLLFYSVCDTSICHIRCVSSCFKHIKREKEKEWKKNAIQWHDTAVNFWTNALEIDGVLIVVVNRYKQTRQQYSLPNYEKKLLYVYWIHCFVTHNQDEKKLVNGVQFKRLCRKFTEQIKRINESKNLILNGSVYANFSYDKSSNNNNFGKHEQNIAMPFTAGNNKQKRVAIKTN